MHAVLLPVVLLPVGHARRRLARPTFSQRMLIAPLDMGAAALRTLRAATGVPRRERPVCICIVPLLCAVAVPVVCG